MIGLATKNSENGGFQLYSVANTALVAKIPNSITYEKAVVLPLAISTASSGLYLKTYLGLPYPTTSPKPTGKSILINGASSSVGAVAVQLAVASGLKVITTASPKNHDLAVSLGATEVFDHRDPDIVEKLVKALKSAGEFAGVYDAIAGPETLKVCASVTEKLGGGFMACTLDPPKDLPAGVKASWCKCFWVPS